MRFLKLTFVAAFAFLTLTGCEKAENNVKVSNNLVLNGDQEVPATQTTGSGVMDAWYDMKSKTLNYVIRWNGLTGPVTMAHIHGPAEKGVNAGILQTFFNFPAAASGVYSGSVVVDEVVIREVDVLNSRLYVNIHTARFPGGEIRGQILMP